MSCYFFKVSYYQGTSSLFFANKRYEWAVYSKRRYLIVKYKWIAEEFYNLQVCANILKEIVICSNKGDLKACHKIYTNHCLI